MRALPAKIKICSDAFIDDDWILDVDCDNIASLNFGRLIMGYIPSHGPDCVRVKAHPTNCGYCGKFVVYTECSHGSKVFFNPMRGGVHDCRGAARSASRGASQGFSGGGAVSPEKDFRRMDHLLDLMAKARRGEGTIKCPACGEDVANNKARMHFVHKCSKMGDWFSR